MSNNTSDEQIAVQVQMAPEMFGFLIDRYEKKLDRYILRSTSLPQDLRDDILQEVFVKTYENIASFDQRLSFNSWIYRICHNTIINDWKKNKKYREGQSFDYDDSNFLENLLSEDNSLDFVVSQENSKFVLNALDSVPDKHRDILMLRYFEDLSYEEIGDVLKIPGGTVGNRIYRAKASLRNELLEKVKI